MKKFIEDGATLAILQCFVKIIFVVTWKLILYIEAYIFINKIYQGIYLNSQILG